MGCSRSVDGAFSVRISSRAMPMGRGVPNREAQGKPVPLDSSVQIPN